MPATHDHALVVLSLLISVLGAYAARALVERIREARGRAWLAWLVGGAMADGVGTWSMHYTAMLGFHLPVPVLYDWPTVVLSLGPFYPPVHALLAAPVASPTRVYGWVALIDKIGADEFGEEDERLAGMLAAQVGRIYQNGSLYADVLRHASELEREVGERKRAEQRQAILLAVNQALAASVTLRLAMSR